MDFNPHLTPTLTLILTPRLLMDFNADALRFNLTVTLTLTLTSPQP